ncbi:MAG: hypothetical protein WDM87_15040 [Terracidiphilus sp.]
MPWACWRRAYAQTGQTEKAEVNFRLAVERSTLSETYLNFADFLASQGQNTEAREWAKKVLDKRPTMPAICAAANAPGFAAPKLC